MSLDTLLPPETAESTPAPFGAPPSLRLSPARESTRTAPATLPRSAIWLRVLTRLFWAILAVSCVVAAISTVRGLVADGDFMYSDGAQLYHVLRVRDGLLPFPDFTQPPYIPQLYWPLHLGLAGLIARAADLDAYGTLLATRGITLVGTLAAGASIAGIAALCGARRGGAIVAALLFLTAFVVHPWAYAARPDLSALGLVLVGLYVLLKVPSGKGALLAGLIMGAGFTSKQTFVACVGVCGLVLLWRREINRAVLLGAGWLAVVGGTALWMTYATKGRFLEQTVGANAWVLRYQTVLDQLYFYVPLALPVLALAAVGWRAGPRTSFAHTTARLYTVVALLLGLVATARTGSSYNYLIEATAVFCILAGLGFERCLATLARLSGAACSDRPSALPPKAALAAMTVAVTSLVLPLSGVAFYAADPPRRTALIQELRGSPGLVLTEKDALAVILAGKEPVGGDPLSLSGLTRSGRWASAPIDDLLLAHAYTLIALNRPAEQDVAYDEFPWWPIGTRELIQQEYRFDRMTADGFYLYVPR